ncbi:MAG: L,D-transpeptidase [Patescibacteria group bacterium]
MKKIFKIKLITLLLLTPLALVGAVVFAMEKKIEVEGKLTDKNGQVINSSDFSRGEFVQLDFTSGVDKKSVLQNFSIEPQIKTSHFWVNNKTLRIKIEDYLKPETQYQARLSNFKSRLGLDIQKRAEVEFSAAPVPQKMVFYPKDEKREVDYTENLEMVLDKSLPDGYFLNFSIEPYVKVDYEISEDRKKIIFDPQKEFLANTRYRVSVQMKHKAYEDFFQDLHSSEFVTKKPEPVVYGFDESGNPTKTEERSVLPEPRILEGKYIDIDLSKQRMSIFENGKELGAYKISSGTTETETPVGEFEVMGRAPRPWSDEYELFMPWFIQFTADGHGIHELPEWPGGAKEGSNHLGIPVSHGCVRLGVGPAKKVYEFADLGVPIVIHY